MSKIFVHLRDRETGDAAVYEMEWDFEKSPSLDYQFRDGNYGCDDNRSNFLAEAIDGDYDTDLPCNVGRNRIAIDRILNEAGEVVYQDEDADA